MDEVWERIEAAIELLPNAARDDPRLTELCSDLGTMLKFYALGAGLQASDAEDIAAECLERIITKIDLFTYLGEGSFRRWSRSLAASERGCMRRPRCFSSSTQGRGRTVRGWPD